MQKTLTVVAVPFDMYSRYEESINKDNMQNEELSLPDITHNIFLREIYFKQTEIKTLSDICRSEDQQRLSPDTAPYEQTIRKQLITACAGLTETKGFVIKEIGSKVYIVLGAGFIENDSIEEVLSELGLYLLSKDISPVTILGKHFTPFIEKLHLELAE